MPTALGRLPIGLMLREKFFDRVRFGKRCSLRLVGPVFKFAGGRGLDDRALRWAHGPLRLVGFTRSQPIAPYVLCPLCRAVNLRDQAARTASSALLSHAVRNIVAGTHHGVTTVLARLIQCVGG